MTTTRSTSLFTLAALLAVALFAQQPQVTVTDYTLVSEQRVDRTHSAFTYTATLTNRGAAIPRSIQGRPTVHGAGVTCSFCFATWPPLPAGGSAQGTPFTVTVDRAGQFSPNSITWVFRE